MSDEMDIEAGGRGISIEEACERYCPRSQAAASIEGEVEAVEANKDGESITVRVMARSEIGGRTFLAGASELASLSFRAPAAEAARWAAVLGQKVVISVRPPKDEVTP